MASPFALLFPRKYLLVANLARNGPVLRYDIGSGQFVDAFISEGRPDVQFGDIELLPFDVQKSSDGWIFALTLNPREVWRYSQSDGGFAGLVVPNLEKKNDYRQAFCIAFGPDSNLYLSTYSGVFGAGSEVLRFDSKTGASLGMFVPTKSGGLQGATCMTFGPDGNLYVAGDENAAILRFNGFTGAFMDAFVPAHPYADSVTPRGLAFGPDGHLYALAGPPRQAGAAPSYVEPDRILRYDGATGALMGEFVSPGPELGTATAIVFGPDGNLYVGTTKQLVQQTGPVYSHTGRILVYNGTTGAFIRALDPLDRAKLSYPISMTFATIPISIRDIIFMSRIPRWLWAFGIGIIIGAIASRLSSYSRGIGGIRNAR